MRYNIDAIWRQEMSKKSDKFVEIASPNKQGFSNNIDIEDLPLELKGNNGEEKQKSGGRYGKLISIQLVGKK